MRAQGIVIGGHESHVRSLPQHEKNCAFNTQHQPTPPSPRLTGHEITSNLRGHLLHCSESAHFKSLGSLMLCGRNYRSRHWSLAHFRTTIFQTELGPITHFRLNKIVQKWVRGSQVSSKTSDHTVSMTLTGSSERSQGSGANSLQGLTPSRAL